MRTLSAKSRGSALRLAEALREWERRQARLHLSQFVRQAWPILNPGRPLEWGWYLDSICRHLAAVYRGDLRLRRLIITQPPNTLKSTIVAVCWPAWVWADNPGVRFLYASADGPLASRDATAMRDLIGSDWYQDSFAPTWGLKEDQDQKTWFVNTAGGHRISYGVGAKVIGRKGDILVVDDANDAKKVHSPVEREAITQWHDFAFATRGTDERNSPEVVVGQRLHPGDLIGHLKKRGGFVELRLAEEYDPDRRCETPIGSGDPRHERGAWLRPNRFAEPEKREALSRLTRSNYEAQHNQNPRDPLEDSYFRRQSFGRYTDDGAGHWFSPKRGKVEKGLCQVVASVDPACSEKQAADYSAIVVGAITPANDLFLLDVIKERVTPEKLIRLMLDTAGRLGVSWYSFEDSGFQTFVAREARRVPGMPPVRESAVAGKGKVVRATPAMVKVENGQVFVPHEAPWLDNFFDLVEGFRGEDEENDVVDAFADLVRQCPRVAAEKKAQADDDVPERANFRDRQPTATRHGMWGRR